MSSRSEAFGAKLSDLINRDGLNVAWVSRKLGIPDSTLRNYMSGQIMPKRDTLYRIADFFRCDPDWLYEYPGDFESGWKRHNTYDEYELNTDGRIRNIHTGRILKTRVDEKGYENVSLRKDNRSHTERVHRLMADTFMDNIPEGMDVYHENLNRSDNRLENLKYCTKSETSKRGFEKGVRQGRGHIPVRIEKIGNPNIFKTFNSIRECADYLGVSIGAVSKCAHGATVSCKGYKIRLI